MGVRSKKNTGIDSRQGVKYAKFRNRKIDNFYKPSHSFFPTFAALASLREILRVSVAALPRWVISYPRFSILILMMLLMRVATTMLAVAEDQRLNHNRHCLGVRKFLADVDEIKIPEIDAVDGNNPGAG